jgi:hypothetical protein
VASIELQTNCGEKVWHKAPGGYVLTTAAEGEWDGGCIFARHSLVELPDGTRGSLARASNAAFLGGPPNRVREAITLMQNIDI